MSYRPFWTGVGIIAGYGLIILGSTFYLRKWIGPSRWRVAHRFIAVFWILGLFHTFGAGTDAGETWLMVLVAVTALPALILLGMRLGVHGKSDRPLFHGRIGETTAADVRQLDRAALTAFMMRAVGAERLSPAMTAALPQVGRTLSSWPQLASGVLLGGALVTDSARRILLGEPVPSGSYSVDLDALIPTADVPGAAVPAADVPASRVSPTAEGAR